ncbi:N-acetylmuramic acid 6-phosphate etherase [Gilvibacter sediminis]|uniref:N-acetylmuramic acid 6-phosphate etherase n=1 Tax=Gilvibacter sediminis TaxID=379071 RepID=UPI00235069F1|nr:N-acetylmuramic acid 6-phosphate etherase [Gilvibacter sediminis]MDC7997810.1 N-acetylmuramic acid 6-phosphate etherase [Gilvibacter sediminis]
MFHKTTESDSLYNDLEQKSTRELLVGINTEDQKVPQIISGILPAIEEVVEQTVSHLRDGGRLFYLGAGTSGRLGIVDASECPPTFGVPHEMVIGLIAGGDQAIRKAVEFAEDDKLQGWKDLQEFQVDTKDVVIGIAASGTTPYVIGALEQCNANNIVTGCITCNADSPLAKTAKYPIVAVVGPEFVTGSSRMKAGTAQKLILNMITTATMIRLGRVKDNKMVDMQLSNDKLVERGTRMIVEATGLPESEARAQLLKHQSVRDALQAINDGK